MKITYSKYLRNTLEIQQNYVEIPSNTAELHVRFGSIIHN